MMFIKLDFIFKYKYAELIHFKLNTTVFNFFNTYISLQISLLAITTGQIIEEKTSISLIVLIDNSITVTTHDNQTNTDHMQLRSRPHTFMLRL